MRVYEMLAADNSIPINLLRQWYFCPRIPYYQELLGTQVVRPPWVRQGNEYEVLQQKLFRRRNLSRFGLSEGTLHTQVRMTGPGEPFHGVADLVIETTQAVHVTEIKLNLEKVSKGVIAQLAALSILAEAEFGKPATDAFIVYGRKPQVRCVQIGSEMREKTRELAYRIQKILISGVKPDSPASEHQCAQCEYFNYCNDR